MFTNILMSIQVNLMFSFKALYSCQILSDEMCSAFLDLKTINFKMRSQDFQMLFWKVWLILSDSKKLKVLAQFKKCHN